MDLESPLLRLLVFFRPDEGAMTYLNSFVQPRAEFSRLARQPTLLINLTGLLVHANYTEMVNNSVLF